MSAVVGLSPIPMLSGVLLVNKPSGPTSYDLIRWLRRGRRTLKVGHAGTLDPLASGLMILLVGAATKRQDGFMKLDKTYLCGIRLGRRTDTADIQGQTTEEKEIPPLTTETILEACRSFVGAQTQIPPMYAAIKKDGVPLYKLARKGQVIEREPRSITLYSVDFLDFENGLITLRVRCSSGTYVRTLAEDLAQKLGTLGCVESLVREEIGTFHLREALPGESLQNATDESLLSFLQKSTVS